MTWFRLVLHWAVDVIEVIYYAQWSTRINQMIFCCFRCVIEQWALTVIKLLRFFVLIFAVFLSDFIFFCNTVGQSHPYFIKIVDVFDLYTP